MDMRSRQSLVAVASTIVLAGCLYTDEPLGEPAVFEPADWNGLWLCSKGELERLAVDPKVKALTWAEDWRDCHAKPADHPLSKSFRRQHGEWFFEDCEGRLVTGRPCEYWTIFSRWEEAVIMYVADDERIRQLLDEGKVSGRIELVDGKNRVVLHSVTVEHYKVLLNPDKGAFRPTGYQCIRLPLELDPCKDASRPGSGVRPSNGPSDQPG